MIDKKTGRLFATAAEIGGVIGGGTRRETESLRRFGQYLGRAFQLQDDLLDVLADGRTFGKSIGGDIIERKRTYLLLRSAERAGGNDRAYLVNLLKTAGAAPGNREQVIGRVTDIYRRLGVIEEARALVRKNTSSAFQCLDRLRDNAATQTLRWLSGVLMTRDS
jgi:geranylgeranyl diphosphate synthase type II